MENNKYYTPEETDFHLGFEYYTLSDPRLPEKESSWDKVTIASLGDLEDFIRYYNNGQGEEQYKIKYLDRQDIESLGFISLHVINIDSIDDDFVSGYELGNTILYTIDGSKYIIYQRDCINLNTGNWSELVLFRGTIKNKSELQKLMQQLNII